jgi:segregation and condensation protein A
MYRVRLQDFEGPLDLLLFFIRRDELDIYDIPIAQIADEFLDTVRLLGEVDLDRAGDFVYMAALLISIKAKMLMPTPETDEQGEPIDPRRELVERLLEYIRYKEGARILEEQFDARSKMFVRGGGSAYDPDNEAEPEIDATVFDLIRSLRRILTEAAAGEEPTHDIERFAFSIETQRTYLFEQIATGQRRTFRELVQGRERAFVIATFLAVLELVRHGSLSLLVNEDLTSFSLERPLVDDTELQTAESWN